MTLARTIRRTAGAAAPLLLAVACADPVAPPPATAAGSAALARREPLAHWMRVAALPAAYDLVAHDGALYAASSDDGVFRSTDGVRWTRIALFAPGADPGAVALGPSGEMYVGTSAGVVRSDDGGASWRSAGLGDQYVSHVAVDPRGSVFATASGMQGGLFRSDDGGLHWWHVFAPASRGEAFFTFLHVRKGDVMLGIYAQVPWLGFDAGTVGGQLYSMFEIPDFTGAVDDMIETSNGSLVAAWANGLARSADGGQSWKPVFEGTPAFQLVEDPARSALYALVSPGRVLRSTDDGATWTPFAAAPPMTGIDAVAVAPDGRLVVGGYEGVWKATR
jgi:photosystem II stability/assembly factor-like uncharacterized protein